TIRMGGERIHDREIALGAPAQALGILEARLESCGNERLEVAPAELRIGIFAGDDLALLGDAQPNRHAAGRLGEDRLVAWTAAASDGAASTVEQPEVNLRGAKCLHQRHLGAI